MVIIIVSRCLELTVFLTLKIRGKKFNFEKIHCLRRFKNLKSAFFDQNINKLELEGHDELRNNF